MHLGFLFTAECGDANTDISRSLGLCVLVPDFCWLFSVCSYAIGLDWLSVVLIMFFLLFTDNFLPPWYDSMFQHYCNDKKHLSGTDKTLSGPYFGTEGTVETMRCPVVGTEGTAKTPRYPHCFFIRSLCISDRHVYGYNVNCI